MGEKVFNQFERNDHLLKSKMKKYLMAMIFQSASLNLAYLVDSLMIAKYLGTTELVALNIGEVSDYITDIPHVVFGTGGMILVGALWGEGKQKDADKIFSASMYGCIIVGLIIALLGFAADPFASILTSNVDLSLTTDVANYLRITFFISPFVVTMLCLSKFISAAGFPQLTSMYYVIANALNLIMDYLFFNYTSLGIKGAALSTGLGYILASVVFIGYLKNKNRMLCFVPVSKVQIRDLYLSFKTGSPNMLNLLAQSGFNSIRSIIVIHFFGVIGMLYVTLCTNLKGIVNLLTDAVHNQLRMLTSVLYAEHDCFGVKRISMFVLKTSIVLTLCVMTFTILYPTKILQMFSITDYPQELCVILQIGAIALLGYQLITFYWNYCQSIQKTQLASMIAIVQNHGIEIVMFGIAGFLALSFNISSTILLPFCTITDYCIAILFVIIIVKVFLKEKNLLMLHTDDVSEELDLSLQADNENAAAISARISDFCKGKGISDKSSIFLGIAGEEIVTTIMTYMDDLHGYVDLNVRLINNQAIMRVRDDGKPFNPFTHESVDLDDFDSVAMLKKIAKEIHYTRAMDMNNTIIILDVR